MTDHSIVEQKRMVLERRKYWYERYEQAAASNDVPTLEEARDFVRHYDEWLRLIDDQRSGAVRHNFVLDVHGKPCDGSLRQVIEKRDQVKPSKDGHMTGSCPVCNRVVRLRRVLGALEFTSHEPAQVPLPPPSA